MTMLILASGCSTPWSLVLTSARIATATLPSRSVSWLSGGGWPWSFLTMKVRLSKPLLLVLDLTLSPELPPGLWHTLVAFEPGSIFFETKPGPYVPLSAADLAPWSPAEGAPKTDDYLTHLLSRIS